MSQPAQRYIKTELYDINCLVTKGWVYHVDFIDEDGVSFIETDDGYQVGVRVGGFWQWCDKDGNLLEATQCPR